MNEKPAARTLALFNNAGGVGTTTLTFNLAHMFARQGHRVALIDYDPQCDLTALALSEDDLEACWDTPRPGSTVATCLEPVRLGSGDLQEPQVIEIADGLHLLPGDLDLSRFELELARAWPQAANVTTALDRLTRRVAEVVGADLVLLDMGPGLGLLNRTAMLAADAIVVPVAPDLFSLRGLQNVGAALADWREASVQPLGYIVQQDVVHGARPIKASLRWLREIPGRFARDVLMEDMDVIAFDVQEDPRCLGLLRHFASLVPLAQEARKPLFDLKHADGILGSQFQTVTSAYKAFAELATAIGTRLDALP